MCPWQVSVRVYNLCVFVLDQPSCDRANPRKSTEPSQRLRERIWERKFRSVYTFTFVALLLTSIHIYKRTNGTIDQTIFVVFDYSRRVF